MADEKQEESSVSDSIKADGDKENADGGKSDKVKSEYVGYK